MSEKMFEVAVRSKFRFPFRGSVSVEDLWDLSVEQLDLVFKTLNKESKQASEESLLGVKTRENKVLNTKIDIVKHIVNVKLEEKEARENAIAKKLKREKILELIESKQNEEMNNESVENLQKMLEELG